MQIAFPSLTIVIIVLQIIIIASMWKKLRCVAKLEEYNKQLCQSINTNCAVIHGNCSKITNKKTEHFVRQILLTLDYMKVDANKYKIE